MDPSERGEADQGRTVIGHAERPHPSAGGQYAMESAYDSVEPAPKSARIRGMSLIVGRR